jgi:peptidoglycan hydrolase-like protein with peptidoglycan-binding domain
MGHKFCGLTPDTIKLPIGLFSVTMKHDGESKIGDQEILRNVKSLRTFAFAKPAPPEPPAPVVASTPPPAPAAPAAADAPPAASVNPPAPADTPPAPMPVAPANAGTTASAQPSAQTLAAATLASQTQAPSPVISAPADGGTPAPNMAAVIAAQSASVNPPEAGYWKLSEIFANSEYRGYSESGRGYIVYKAQQALDESADGVPGKGTYKAIQKFQTEHGLAATGQLDSATLAAMNLTGQPDKSDWSSGSRRSRSEDSSEDKTAARKFIERNLLGGRDLKNIFRR